MTMRMSPSLACDDTRLATSCIDNQRPSRRRFAPPQDDEVLPMALKAYVILRSPRQRASRRTHDPDPGTHAGLLLRRQQVADAAQREVVAGDREAGDDALADRGRLRGRAAADRVRDMHLDRRKLDLRDRRDERRIARAEGCRVEDRRVEAAIVRLVELVD